MIEKKKPLKISGSPLRKNANVGNVVIPNLLANPVSSVVTNWIPLSSASSSIFSKSSRTESQASPSSHEPPSFEKNGSLPRRNTTNVIKKETCWNRQRRIHFLQLFSQEFHPSLLRWYLKLSVRSATAEHPPHWSNRLRKEYCALVSLY